MTIWKFSLALQERQPIEMPIGAQFLTVQEQRGTLQLWAIVDPTRDTETRIIHIVGTGHTIPGCPLAFIGSVQHASRDRAPQLDGAFVWHVFVEAK